MTTSLKELTARILAFFRRDKLDREFDQELESHLTMLPEDHPGLNATVCDSFSAIRTQATSICGFHCRVPRCSVVPSLP